MTSNMTDSPWSIEENRDRPGGQILNSNERYFCATGSTLSDGTRKRDIKRRIREHRLPKLPERIQDLIDDLALIHYSDTDFLSNEEWRDLWKEIRHVDRHGKTANRPDVRFTTNEYHDENIQFGFEIGNLVNNLNNSPRLNSVNIIWGFILGIYSLPEEAVEIEKEWYTHLFDKLSELADQRAESMRELKHVHGLQEDIHETTERRWIQELGNCGVDVDFSHDLPTEMASNFYKEYDSIPPNNSDIRDILITFYEPALLSALDDLRMEVEHDASTLDNKMVRGVEVRDVLEELWDAEAIEYLDTHGITVREMNFKKRQKVVKSVLNMLSTENSEEGLAEHRTVAEHRSGWKLTPYGEIVCHSIFRLNRNYEWIYQYEISPSLSPYERELIDRVNDEFDYW